MGKAGASRGHAAVSRKCPKSRVLALILSSPWNSLKRKAATHCRIMHVLLTAAQGPNA